MVKYLFLFTFLLLSYPICTQNINIFPCDTLIKSDSLKVAVSGNCDHNEIQITWIQNEITTSNFTKWSDRWIESNFYTGDKLIDSLQHQIYQEQKDRLTRQWRLLKNKLEQGDRIYYYTTPKKYWEALAGQDGLLIIRNCVLMSKLILLQS